VGRWLLAFSLWAFAAGVFAGPALSYYGDRAMAAAIPWMASSAPKFLRPYLPNPPEAPRSLPHHANVPRAVPATPPVPAKHEPHASHLTHAKSAAARKATAETGDPFELHQ
jgi:hypothetical protein